MGRYNLIIEKLPGPVDKAVTRVEVTGFLAKALVESPSQDEVPPNSEAPLDNDGNLTTIHTPAPPPLPDELDEVVRLVSFDVTNPVARFIKIVTYPSSDPSRCVIWEAVPVSKTLKEEKSVQILHRRKSAGRVRSFSEATSIILNKKPPQPEVDSDPESEGMDMDDIDVVDSDEAETLELDEPLCPDKSNTFRIDLFDLTDKMVLKVDTDRDSLEVDGGGSVVKVEVTKDENGNAEHDDLTVKEPPAQAVLGVIPETPELTDPPITMSITVANDLIIHVELDNNFERLDTTEGTGVGSVQSLVEPDTVFYLPYQDVFLNGLPGTSRQSPLPEYLKEKPHPERVERKRILRKLILERLLAFGTPNVDALDITDTWFSGYVQHRALSYRVPRMRVATKDKIESESKVGDVEKVKPVQIQLGAKLPDSAGYIENFIYHANYLKGILNSATCTTLECTFYLMIPHFKTQTDPSVRHLPGAGISTTFIKDWFHVLSTAAYQLKPSEPGAITDMVKKETKVLKSVLVGILKEHKKMKERLKYIQDKVDILKEKTHERIRLDAELATEIQHDEEPVDYAGFAHLQMVGFTGPEIFPKYLHFLTGKYGLFLKKEIGEAWFPYSDLNFLERRVIYLGLMDHVTSSFESVLTTVRHLEEIYTPGYPMNLLTRFKPLFDLLLQPKPYQLLATESKLALYAGACGCVGALKRFRAVYRELIRMVKETKGGLDRFDYTAGACAEFNAKLGAGGERVPKINLVVPFATLNLEGFANLAQRGTSIPVDDIGKSSVA